MSETLELYYYPACPYCQKVLRAIHELGVEDAIELKNIRANGTYQKILDKYLK